MNSAATNRKPVETGYTGRLKRVSTRFPLLDTDFNRWIATNRGSNVQYLRLFSKFPLKSDRLVSQEIYWHPVIFRSSRWIWGSLDMATRSLSNWLFSLIVFSLIPCTNRSINHNCSASDNRLMLFSICVKIGMFIVLPPYSFLNYNFSS